MLSAFQVSVWTLGSLSRIELNARCTACLIGRPPVATGVHDSFDLEKNHFVVDSVGMHRYALRFPGASLEPWVTVYGRFESTVHLIPDCTSTCGQWLATFAFTWRKATWYSSRCECGGTLYCGLRASIRVTGIHGACSFGPNPRRLRSSGHDPP